ncbi:hypothetical protein LINGRAHAP2_LOCUS25089 [Linum grandiflorum]
MTEFYICEICGGTDYENDGIIICTKCCLTKEHLWCTRALPEEDKPWVCEECRESKEEVVQGPESLSPQPQNKVVLGELTTAGPSRNRYPSKKYVKPSKVILITEEEVKKLNSGAENVRTSKTTIISRPRKMLHRYLNVPVKGNPRIPSSFTKNGRDGGRNAYLNFSPSATRTSEVAGPNNVVKLKKPLVTSLTPVECRRQFTKDVGIEALNTNVEQTMIRSQTPLTLVGRSQQSQQVVRVNDLQSGEQETKNGEEETKKASGTPLTSVQKQNQLIEGCNSRASLEDMATLVQKLRFYESYFPANRASWTGRCRILDHAEGGKFQDGLMAQLSSRVRKAYGLSLELPVELQAHPAARIHRKAYELSLKMAAEHEVKLLPRSDIWTLLFHDDSPDLRDIALYIFPTADVESSEDNYAKLLECMEAEDLAIRTDVDGFELLIFSSKHLHADIQDVICYWSRKQFFWGVFKQPKAVVQVALPVPDYGGLDHDHDHSNITDHEDVEMEIDMEGGREIGLPDIVVKKNHDDHSSFHQEEVAMEVDMEGGNDLGPPEIVVRENYSSLTGVKSDDGQTADKTPSKVTTGTTTSPCNESGKKTPDDVKEAAFPAEFGNLSSKKCKLEPAGEFGNISSKKCKLEPAEPAANQMDVQGLIKVKVERQDPEGSMSVLWTPPPADWVKLNVAVSSSSNGTTYAGIIRDSAAKWLVGYNLNMGLGRNESKSMSLEAEFQALDEGLKLAWEGGFRKVVVELESSAAVEFLKKDGYPHPDSNIGLISRCKERMRSKWECKLQVSRQEENLSAQLLAQHFMCKPSGLNILKDPPDDLNLFLKIDHMNTLST